MNGLIIKLIILFVVGLILHFAFKDRKNDAFSFAVTAIVFAVVIVLINWFIKY